MKQALVLVLALCFSLLGTETAGATTPALTASRAKQAVVSQFRHTNPKVRGIGGAPVDFVRCRLLSDTFARCDLGYRILVGVLGQARCQESFQVRQYKYAVDVVMQPGSRRARDASALSDRLC